MKLAVNDSNNQKYKYSDNRDCYNPIRSHPIFFLQYVSSQDLTSSWFPYPEKLDT